MNLLFCFCVLFYSSFVCISAYANVYFKTKFMCPRSIAGRCSIWSGASGLPYYCTPPVCISAVIRLLAVWQYTKPKTKKSPSSW